MEIKLPDAGGERYISIISPSIQSIVGHGSILWHQIMGPNKVAYQHCDTSAYSYRVALEHIDMAYVITEPCIGVKDKSCVSVCPVDCIHEGTYELDGQNFDMLFINPDECIDCGLCEPECPVTAIFADSDVPKVHEGYIQINSGFYK